MTEVTRPGRLGAREAARLLERLRALPGVSLAAEVRWRARPRGIEDGFDAGADADRVLAIDPKAPGGLRALGEDLASLEVEVDAAGTPWVLAITTQREDTGTAWTASLDPLGPETPPPPWWPEVLGALGSSP